MRCMAPLCGRRAAWVAAAGARAGAAGAAWSAVSYSCAWPGARLPAGGGWCGRVATGATVYRAIYAVLLRRLPAEAAHRAGFWLIRAAASVPGLAWALRRFFWPARSGAAGAGAGAGLPRAAWAGGRVRQGRGGGRRAGRPRVRVRRGRHRDRAAAAGQPEAADVPLPGRARAGQPDGVQQPRRGGAGARLRALRARPGYVATVRSSASTSARPRSCRRRRRSPTT